MLRPVDLENQLLLAQAARPLDAERVRQFHQFRDRPALQLEDVEPFGRTLGHGRGGRGRRRGFSLFCFHFFHFFL
jgi:hypothetical protein